jgi:hypothetical protein
MTLRTWTARAALLAALLASAPLASAGVWTVDDDGGPGVDFTDIQPAVVAAAPGDTILVAPGTYGTQCDLRVDKPLRILGTGAQPSDVYLSCWNPSVRIVGVGGKHPVVLANLSGSGWVEVWDCQAPVLLIDIGLAVEAYKGRDVRVRNMSTPYTWVPYVSASSGTRVEAVSSAFQGRAGYSSYLGPGGSGGSGVSLSNSRGHLAGCSSTGGRGGDVDAFSPLDFAGDGGPGISASGSTVYIAGSDTSLFLGGLGGDSPWACGYEGYGGPGLSNNSSEIDYSLATFQGGLGGWPCGGASMAGPAMTHGGSGGNFGVTPFLPWLELLGSPTPGSPITFRVHARDGAEVTLFLGRKAILAPEPGIEVEQLCDRLRAFQLGPVQSGNQIDRVLTLPGYLTPGAVIVAQAQVRLASGVRHNTNSAPIVVR